MSDGDGDLAPLHYHWRLVRRRSTSIHRLNADHRLNTIAQAAYVTLNWFNNRVPYAFRDPQLAIRDFVCPALETAWREVPRGASPSRALSDLFWLMLPWSAIRDELGAIRILDVGCGSGNHGPRLIAWSNDQIASYTGTDARRRNEWTALETGDPRLHFRDSRAENVHGIIPDGTNMFMSQSAVEHFDEDLGFFEQIRDYVRATEGPVLQVHLVPSQACLRLYRLHGARQYTPRTLSKITRLFAPDAYAVLYRLGGQACNRLHYSFITKPLLILRSGDRRNEEPEEYDRQLFAAVSRDMQHPQASPAFYALIIHSRSTRRIF